MSQRGKIIDPSKAQRDDFIYLAGMIDGDGCFYISKRTLLTKGKQPQYMMKIQVHCINESFIDHLHSVFGGVKIIYRRKPPRRFLYGVEFTGNLLTNLCEMLLPHIRLKKPNCQNMLEMRKTYNGTGGQITVPQSIIDIREQCFLRSRELNTHKPYVIPPCCPSVLSS